MVGGWGFGHTQADAPWVPGAGDCDCVPGGREGSTHILRMVAGLPQRSMLVHPPPHSPTHGKFSGCRDGGGGGKMKEEGGKGGEIKFSLMF